MSDLKNKIKIKCRLCKHKTNHTVLASEHVSYDEYIKKIDYHIDHLHEYQITKCDGCETVSFRIVYTCSDERDMDTGEYLETEWLYPEIDEIKEPIEGYDKFPYKTKEIYKETLKAINNNSKILAAIGLRALIESICIERNTTSRILKDKIEELYTQDLLSKSQCQFLHKLRFLGNEAAHEILPPNESVLSSSLEIAETLLKTIYILPEIANKI